MNILRNALCRNLIVVDITVNYFFDCTIRYGILFQLSVNVLLGKLKGT